VGVIVAEDFVVVYEGRVGVVGMVEEEVAFEVVEDVYAVVVVVDVVVLDVLFGCGVG